MSVRLRARVRAWSVDVCRLAVAVRWVRVCGAWGADARARGRGWPTRISSRARMRWRASRGMGDGKLIEIECEGRNSYLRLSADDRVLSPGRYTQIAITYSTM